MKIKSPNETVLLNGTTIRTLLESVKENRRGRLRNFFNDANNWRAFVADNERLSIEFKATNDYCASTVNYASVKESLINLYKGSSSFSECKYISDIRKSYRSVRCPYCGQGVCSSLDHYFDKDAFCELSLNVWNLVPSCGDCNFTKLNSKINSPTKRFLHPFFDEYFVDGSAIQLYFIHIELFRNPHIPVLTLIPHPNLDNDTKSVVKWHIEKMEIESRNGLIIRADFAYWVKKVRKKAAKLNTHQLILEFLQDEYEDEIEFSWRAAVLYSIISNYDNFQTFYSLTMDHQFSLNPS